VKPPDKKGKSKKGQVLCCSCEDVKKFQKIVDDNVAKFCSDTGGPTEKDAECKRP
jgi:hypothetical protein